MMVRTNKNNSDNDMCNKLVTCANNDDNSSHDSKNSEHNIDDNYWR